MHRFRSMWVGLALMALLLAACAPVPLSPATNPPETPITEDPLTQPTKETLPAVPVPTPTRPPAGPTAGEDLPEAIENAIATFSQTLGSDAIEVTVISYEQITWTDSCLGLGQPNEMCLQALTPGYLIHLEVDGTAYEVHTDSQGANVRTKGIAGPIGVLPDPNQPLPVLAALRSLSASQGIPAGQIEVVSVEEVEWSDSCLGLGGPQEICAAVITPGFLIILRAGGQKYEFHTDSMGENLRQK